MKYNVILSGTYGAMSDTNMTTKQFMTGSQNSCLVVFVRKGTTAAMAHILSAHIAGTNPENCRKRLAGFWDFYLNFADKDEVTFITAPGVNDSTRNAITAIKNAMEDKGGNFGPNVEAGESEYTVDPRTGAPTRIGISRWRAAGQYLKDFESHPCHQALLKYSIGSGLPGNVLYKNTFVTESATDVELL